MFGCLLPKKDELVLCLFVLISLTTLLWSSSSPTITNKVIGLVLRINKKGLNYTHLFLSTFTTQIKIFPKILVDVKNGKKILNKK